MSYTKPEPLPAERRFRRTWKAPEGLGLWFAVVNNQRLGTRFMVTAFIFFLIGGVLALLMRAQLAVPENTLLAPETYNRLMTMHGSTMMFLFIVPFLEGVAVYFLPLLIGSRDVAFPRLTALGYWTYLFGGLIFYASFFVGAVPSEGWFAYPPLSNGEYSPGLGMDFWLFGLSLAELSGITAGVELSITILKMRAPGMRLSRMPLFAWAILVTAFMILFAFPVLLTASLLLELDRSIGTQFFDPSRGGSPLLWQHLFWIFGHPEVYIQFLPATGIVSMIIPTFARRPIVGYTVVVLALVTTGFVSFGLWVHHMFTTGLPELSLSFFSVASFAVALASGAQVFAWIATIWGGKPVFKTPFLFTLGFLFIFVIGGITGVMVASVPFDWQVHDSYFVVAHFHYVLIGGSVFPVLAGLYYWLPKLTGRLLHEGLGKWNFWLVFIGFNVTFFPMHLLGLLGMPRRVYTYQGGLGWEGYNFTATVGAFVLAAGFLLFVVNFIWSLYRGERAGDDPWGAESLEWSVSSPPPVYSFHTPPTVHSRHPLWDQEQPHEDEPSARAVRALSGGPLTWRATLNTSVVDAEPQAIHYLPGPTYVAFVVSVGLLLAAVGMLAKLYLLAGVGGLVALIALIVWLWPSQRERELLQESELSERAGLPIVTTGSRMIGWWGMVFLLITLAVILASLLFSYFYIGLQSALWPQGELPLPELRLPGLALTSLVLSAAPMAWALSNIRRNHSGLTLLGLVLSFFLGAVFLGLQFYTLLELPFTPQTNAYGSLFYVLNGFLLLLALTGLALGTGAQFRTGLGHFNARNFVALQNVALFWYFVVGTGLVIFMTLYVSPRLF